MTQIITDWQTKHEKLFGRHAVKLNHSLAGSPLFSDDALARLIETSSRDSYHVNYSQKTPGNPPRRREGEIRDLSGKDVLDVLKKGNIWINLTAPGPAYEALADQIFGEFEERVPGFRSERHV